MTPEFKLCAVERAAKEQNGWHVIAVVSDRARSGTRPNGIIAFVNYNRVIDRPHSVGNCGTAMFVFPEDGVPYFIQGHYDLSRDDAMVDLVKRCALFIDSDAAKARV